MEYLFYSATHHLYGLSLLSLKKSVLLLVSKPKCNNIHLNIVMLSHKVLVKQLKIFRWNMFVVKRDGSQEPIYFDKIAGRIRRLTWGLSNDIDADCIAKKV